MLRAADMKGVMAMMPAFTTPDGDKLTATDTIDATELARAVDRMIRDGGDVIATMGSFGECHAPQHRGDEGQPPDPARVHPADERRPGEDQRLVQPDPGLPVHPDGRLRLLVD